ncbi:hypothetical protein [Sphingopyxis sp. YR583]|uniref:hypothetical protein n=1 Tax=Sphingopyxis sp. YR583 TaxID=1881047 RepID=UPI000B85FDBD|nr:hypothetical protein [Sphingopyxis sp. YR583]
MASAHLVSPAMAAEQPPSYSAEEVAWSIGFGSNIIDGSGAAAGPSDSATCAGEEVVLRPDSLFERHRNRIIFGSLEGARIPVTRFLAVINADDPMLPVPPKDYEAVARRSHCAIDGKFLFTGVQDGEYYAVTMLFPRGNLGKASPIDDIEVVMKRLKVGGGQTSKLDLLHRDD